LRLIGFPGDFARAQESLRQPTKDRTFSSPPGSLARLPFFQKGKPMSNRDDMTIAEFGEWCKANQIVHVACSYHGGQWHVSYGTISCSGYFHLQSAIAAFMTKAEQRMVCLSV
jgi:hypothetical protein